MEHCSRKYNTRIPGCLNDTIWRNKHLTQDNKVRIYRSAVRPILTYSVETSVYLYNKTTIRNHRDEHFNEGSGENMLLVRTLDSNAESSQ
jgi:hypothetical protein